MTIEALTRRRILRMLAEITGAVVIADVLPAAAQSSDEESEAERAALAGLAFDQFNRFVRLSAVLTGITHTALAPASADPKEPSSKLAATAADPTQAYKLAYFNLAFKDPIYPRLLQQFESAALTPQTSADPTKLSELASTLLGAKDVGALARSIVMAWYFGAWYEWEIPGAGPRFTVISSQGYTQGWIWRIAQAHAPGWSDLRFGYWAFPPSASFDLNSIQLKAI